MAIDVITRPMDGWLTIVHDERNFMVSSLEITNDGRLIATGVQGRRLLGHLTASTLQESRVCDRAMIVHMEGNRVASARKVALAFVPEGVH